MNYLTWPRRQFFKSKSRLGSDELPAAKINVTETIKSGDTLLRRVVVASALFFVLWRVCLSLQLCDSIDLHFFLCLSRDGANLRKQSLPANANANSGAAAAAASPSLFGFCIFAPKNCRPILSLLLFGWQSFLGPQSKVTATSGHKRHSVTLNATRHDTT